jgi:hypothetical protein
MDDKSRLRTQQELTMIHLLNHNRPLLIASLLLVMLSRSAAAAEPKKPSSAELGWKAGVATAKITPQQPMWMAGYGARKKPSEGTTQDLFAKALALEDEGGRRAVIVTMDIIGVLVSLREAVEEQVYQQYNLPPEALLLAASHTHCGPEYRERKGREEEARTYHKFLEDTLVKLVGQSLDNLAPAKLTYNHARAGFAMNRRRNYQLPKDDVNYGKRNNPDGPVDHDVPVVCVSDAEGNQRAVLFGYACHSTTLSFYEFCGDYGGYAQEYLQADHPGLTALFIAGCGADQNPYPRRTLELAQRHGRSLSTAVEAALFANPRPLCGSLRCALEKIELQRVGENARTVVYAIQIIRIGDDVSLIALPSEVVVDYSLRLKRELGKPPAMVWVAAYCNGYFGYIPSARVLAEGGYEAPAYVSTIEEQIVGKVHQMYQRLERLAEAK